MPAHEPRQANILTGSHCFPVWLRLLAHLRDLCYGGDHVAVVHAHTPQSLWQRATLQLVDQVISAWLALLASSHMGRVVSRMPRRWKMTMRPLGQASMCPPHPFVAVLQLFHRLVPEVVSPAHLVCPTCSWHPVPFQISPSNPRISVMVLGRWASLAVVRSKGFIPLSSSSLWWPASRRCRGLPRRPFHVCNSFCRPAPVLGQSPDRSRAESPSFAPNDVFVGVRVPAQPTSIHKLCLAFLQMCSTPSCQNQLSKR